MGKRRKLEEWKKELVGKQFGRLTVLSIQQHIRESTGRKDGFEAVCECACGNTVTIILSNILNFNTTSCGCVIIESSKRNLEKLKQWRSEHPDEVKKIGRESAQYMLQWQKEHPEEAHQQKIEAVKKAQQWKENNSSRVKEIDCLRLEKAHLWRKEHPEEALENSRMAIKEAHKWLKEHPDEYKDFNKKALEKAHEWQKNNPDKVKENSFNGHLIASTRYSKEESEIYNYLMSLGYPVERQFLLKEHLFDFKIGNFLIEYHGSTYHYTEYLNINNPNSKAPPSDQKKINYHKDLRNLAVNNGYSLIQIWDYKWLHNKEFIMKLIVDQLSGVCNYKDYIEGDLLNNDYGFVIDGEQIEPNGVWVDTDNKKIVNDEYTKARVLVYNSGYTKICE